MYKKLHLYIFLTLLITGFCGFTAATASAADADVAQTTTAPTIDGTIDSVWSSASSYSIANVIAGTVSSDSDLSGSWRALWDSTNLYYLVEVTDDALNNDSTDPWDDDSVEIFIDADNSKGTSYDGVNDYQYVFRYNDGTIHLGSNSATNTTGIDFTIVVTANGYTLEVSIPWSTLGVTAAQGNLIGTDVQANDDDDGAGRDGKKAWYAINDNCWQDPSLFATAELVPGAVPPPGQASNPSPPDGATGVSTTAGLSWTAGSGATSHDVYFGDVTSPPFIGNQTATTYDPGTLAEVTTYYWRIDEKNAGGTTTGNVWSFTTAASAGGPEGYTWCASEGQTVVFSEIVDVAYGADGYFNYMYGVTGSITFDNATFGDPIPGTVKDGYYKVVGGGGTGAILREWWTGISGNAISELTSSPDYPDNPTGFNEPTSFEAPTDWADSYGTRMRGYLHPTDSGDYTFWIASDDNGELWLSTNDNPANASLIANVPGWSSSRQWDKYTEQQSSAISLTGGNAYYIEALQKEGGGGDNLAVAWQGPGISQQVIVGDFLSPWAGGGPLPPGQATNPSPADGATGLNINADVSWTAGSGATSHDVYFGQSSPGTFQGNQAGTTFDPGVLANSTTYYWRIDSVNAVGTTTGNVWSFTTAAAGPEPGNGTGLTGDYYDNMDFTAFALTRTDATVNFNWGSDSPDPAIGADTFSVQWTGQVQPMYSETYTFYTNSDDGVRLWVNAQPIIDNWTDHGPTEDSGTIALTAGTKYDIAMDFYENGGGAVAELRWSSPSQAKEIIPQTQLYEAAPQLPGQASNPNPANGASSVSTGADLNWTAGSGATSHDVYFGQSSPGTFQGNQAGTTFDPGTLAENTTYYWCIDEVNANGTTEGVVWSFTTEATPPPGQASNPNPADAAANQSVDVDLSWSAGADATSHDVYFGDTTSPPFIVNQTATTYDPGTLSNLTTYYWRIDEVGAGGTTTGVVWSFTTAAGGGQTTLNPTADASSQGGGCEAASLSFSLWNHILMKFDLASAPTPVTSAVLRLYYESSQALTIYVHDASTDSWDECGTLPTKGSTEMASASATSAGWYEFDVTSYVDTEAEGDNVITFCISNSSDNWWSICAREGPNPPQLVVQFGGGGPPGQATNPNPANGATGVSTTATLSWTTGAGAASHDVYFGTPPSPPFIQNQAATTYNPGTLANGATYYWRIDEKNAIGTTTGDVWNFTTAAAVPPGQASNPSPANGATSVSTSVALSWTAGAGADSHDVYFGQDSTPDSGEFMGNQAGTTYDPGALAATTAYYWRIDEKNAYGTTTGPVWNFTTGSGAPTGMTVGCNFWRIDWGEGGWNHYFASGVDWSTTSNPWNPTFVSELQESKMTCLRFMDWVITNGSAVTSWSQRIPKTANHYYSGNIVPLLNSDGSSAGNGCGVAYEWQIDLCNRIGADIWVTVPHAADADYQHQLATLLYNNLNSNLKVHVEYSNECWNWGFYQTTYCDEQSTAVGIRDLDVGEYCEPWWKYKIYASVRLFEQFENVFGVDSPRLVKAIGCQVGYNWGGYDYNHQIIGELACLNNSTINPNGVTVDAWAAAPYWGTSVGNIADMMLWAHNSLVGTGIKLLCYEGGSDNYSDPAGCTTVQLDPAQEQLYIDALNAIEPYCEGVFCQYCFVGDCWGLKKATGDPASNAPKWRGALQWINSHY